MNIQDFPNPKPNLPKEIRDFKDEDRIDCFKNLENYIKMVSGYIYTDINLDYKPTDNDFMHAWVQRTMSANLLRSLYLRNTFVDAFSSRNMVGIFPPLKAWFEIVGSLASILELLEKNLSLKDFVNEFEPYALGNKGKGSLRVGTVEAKSVATMIDKADKYMNKMYKASSRNKNGPQSGAFFTDFYDVVSNPTHPSSDAHEIVGNIIMEKRFWHGKKPEELKNMITEDLLYYAPTLSLIPVCIQNICQKILVIEKDHFVRLKNKKYFD